MSAARGFTAIPNAVIRDATIPPSTRLLYGVIMSYAWSSRQCTASRETLCADAGIGKSAFFEGISLLRDRGLLDVEKRKSKNGWRNVYVPVAKGVEIPDGDDDGGSPTSGPGVDRDPDGGSSATRTQKKTQGEEQPSADASGHAHVRQSDDAFPEDLPESLHETAIAVGKLLKRTALTRGQRKAVTRAAVGHAVLTFDDRPHLQVAREVEAWLLHGRGARKPCADIVARYRNFLANSEPAAGPPLPAGVTPLHGRRGGRTTVEDYQALKGTMG